MSKIGKLLSLIVVLAIFYFALDLLNYKSWFIFFCGIVVLITCISIISIIVFSIIKSKP